MKELIGRLDRVLDHRVRLGIMSMLVLETWVDFNSLKSELGLTDGNLASHLRALEKAEYILVRKQFLSRRPNTSYLASGKGLAAFRKHLDALEEIARRC